MGDGGLYRVTGTQHETKGKEGKGHGSGGGAGERPLVADFGAACCLMREGERKKEEKERKERKERDGRMRRKKHEDDRR